MREPLFLHFSTSDTLGEERRALMTGLNLYIFAATLLLFSLVSFGISLTGIAHEPGSPADAVLWRTIGLFLLVVSLIAALMAVLQHMFEQAERRVDEQRRQNRDRKHRS